MALTVLAFMAFLFVQGCLKPALAQTTEKLNPADPNYNIELNDLLQNFGASINTNNNNVNTLQGYFTSNLLALANGGTNSNLSGIAAGNLLVTSGGNVGIGTFGQGTSGNFLVSGGLGANPTWTPANFASLVGTFSAGDVLVFRAPDLTKNTSVQS